MNQLTRSLLMVFAAFIWGSAFVAQSMGADLLPALTFNAFRSLIAVGALLAVILLFSKIQKKPFLPAKESRKDLLIGGICCGVALTVSSGLQQMGLADTDPGKAGFITALYIVLVPIFGLFLKKKAPGTVWLAVVLAVAGLYFLCIKKGIGIETSDLLVLGCAFCFTGHILVVDHFSQRVDALWLSCVQFMVVTVLSAFFALFFEEPDLGNLTACLFPLFYTGLLSSGVAFTLQIVAQKGANPTVVSLMMSLESVFSVLTGAVVLREWPTEREFLGCGLMLAAILLAQLPPLKIFKKKRCSP